MQSEFGAVYLGRLMDPDEIKEASANQTGIPEKIRQSWCLCGDVTEEFWVLINRTPNSDKGFRLSLFMTPDDNAYVMFTIQVEDMQSRFLLALSDPKVQRFINNAQKTGIWLSLGRNDGDSAMLQEFLVHADHLQPIAQLKPQRKVVPLEDAFLEFALAADVAQNPCTIPSVLESFNVRQVSLNVIKTYTA